MKRVFTTAMLAGLMVFGLVPMAQAAEGNAYGNYAGALCDLTGDDDHGQPAWNADETYWANRGYSNRGQCVKAEGQSLQRGEWDPAAWGLS